MLHNSYNQVSILDSDDLANWCQGICNPHDAVDQSMHISNDNQVDVWGWHKLTAYLVGMIAPAWLGIHI